MGKNFFKIQDVKDSDSEKLEDFLKNAQKELSVFFGIGVRLPSVFFIQSRKQYDDIWKMQSKDWMVGGADGKNIFILDPKIYTKESNHKDKNSFWKVLKHEYCHIAFRQFCNHGMPKWLNEGLSCYLASQEKNDPTKEDALKVFEYYSKADWQIYSIGYFWVKFLVEKFGKEKLLKLLKELNLEITEKQFAKNFYKIYGIKYTKKGLKEVLESK